MSARGRLYWAKRKGHDRVWLLFSSDTRDGMRIALIDQLEDPSGFKFVAVEDVSTLGFAFGLARDGRGVEIDCVCEETWDEIRRVYLRVDGTEEIPCDRAWGIEGLACNDAGGGGRVIWAVSHRASTAGRRLADRHYPRRAVGEGQFVAPGSPLVLVTDCGRAVWVTLRQKHVRHGFPGAWNCVIFRNEGAGRSSDMIREACAASRAVFGEPPIAGLVTFVDPARVRHKRDPGRCFRRAGFVVAGETPGGHGRNPLVILRLDADAFPPAESPIGHVPLLAEGWR